MRRREAPYVVVVGGGVTGLSAAWWLCREGANVVVLDRGLIGFEASGRNGGGATHHFSPLFREEQRLWPQMDELLGYPTEFRPFRIRIACTEAQSRGLEQVIQNAARQGFVAERLDLRSLRELVPLVGPNALDAIFCHFGGHANPQRTVQAYARAIQDLGGDIIQNAAAVDFIARNGQVTEVVTSSGTFRCDAVVIAAGTATGLLAERIGVDLPLALARVEILVTEPLELFRHGGIDGNGIYGRQTLRGNLLYGGGPHEWLPLEQTSNADNSSTPLFRFIARRLGELFPAARHYRILRAWAGTVENTPDGRPVIDRLKTPGNVVLATLSSVGFGLSPAAGRAIAELVLHGKCSFADISTLSLERFGNLPPDWRETRGWVPTAASAAI